MHGHLFALSPMLEAVRFLEYLIPSTSMPEVVELGPCLIFLLSLELRFALSLMPKVSCSVEHTIS